MSCAAEGGATPIRDAGALERLRSAGHLGWIRGICRYRGRVLPAEVRYLAKA